MVFFVNYISNIRDQTGVRLIFRKSEAEVISNVYSRSRGNNNILESNTFCENQTFKRQVNNVL